MLHQGQHAFLASISSRNIKASYDLLHRRLGHASFVIVSLLNKIVCLFVTSILPHPFVCASCQLSKSKRLLFDLNPKRSLHVLYIIDIFLWGLASVISRDGYRYYVVFIGYFSQFSWFYPLKAKYDSYEVLQAFVNLVETQIS